MKYKVGDEVLVKAKITKCNGDGTYKSETNYSILTIGNKDIQKPPDMTAEEAWDIAKKLFADYSNAELDEIFGKGWSFPQLMEMTPHEAKSKIKAWEAEKGIKVGDEVEFDDTENDIHRAMYVTSKYNDTDYCGICRNGDTYCVHKKELKKTGRHIDIDGLLKQIGVDEQCQ